MILYILIWWTFGVMGSTMIMLGTCTDNQGISKLDILFLLLLSVGGIGTFSLGVPFFGKWWHKSFGEVK